MLNADSYFAMGKSHTICQDYAETKLTRTGVFAGVSDGCSSSPRTDFGSRFLVLAAMNYGGDYAPRYAPEYAHKVLSKPQGLVSRASEALDPLRLPDTVLDATLLIASVVGDQLLVIAYGDGVVDIGFANGDFKTWSIDFNGEAPAYPNYLLNPDRLELYLKDHGTRQVTYQQHIVDQTNAATEKSETRVETTKVTGENFGENFGYVVYHGDVSVVSRVTLCSDGVRSFRRPTSSGVFEPVPLWEVLGEITAIKSTAGQFQVRRMRKFLYEFCPKNGWVHDDDVSVATILNV